MLPGAMNMTDIPGTALGANAWRATTRVMRSKMEGRDANALVGGCCWRGGKRTGLRTRDGLAVEVVGRLVGSSWNSSLGQMWELL